MRNFKGGKDMGHCGATLPLRVNQLRGISDDHTEVFLVVWKNVGQYERLTIGRQVRETIVETQGLLRPRECYKHLTR